MVKPKKGRITREENVRYLFVCECGVKVRFGVGSYERAIYLAVLGGWYIEESDDGEMPRVKCRRCE